MDIQYLKNIGKLLLEMVPRYRLVHGANEPLQVGASGDKTFPMDKAAEDIIIDQLSALKEPMQIVSEERGCFDLNGSTDKIRVLIDPIDGSKNAITGIPFFCTSIAFLDGPDLGDVFLGYVLNLTNGDEFWAQRNQGAFLNGMKITTSKSQKIGAVFYESQNPSKELPIMNPLFEKAYRARSYGSIALALAYMSMGAAGAFINLSKTRPFDIAAAILLVKEAGGLVTDIKGNSIDNVEAGIKHATTILAAASPNIQDKVFSSLGVKG